METVESYKRQETALILLNMAVVAALFFLHVDFLNLLGPPSFALLITLSVRYMILVFEVLWVQRLTESGAYLINYHVHLSIFLNIVFAFLASIYGGTAGSHYVVLMIIPIISAAYRFGLIRTLGVAAACIVLNFLEVWMYYRAHPPADIVEYFEAATVSLVFLVVAVVVWLLVGYLRNQEQKLGKSLKEFQALQEKLVAEEKLAAIGQLSSAIAHEIRNPVSMIASSLKMAESRDVNSAVRQEMFEIATLEAKRLETMTSDFLAFARIKEAKLATVPVCETLNYISGLSRALVLEKDLRLETACTEMLLLEMDAAQMQQALLNLLMNGIKATPSGGRIILGAEKRDEVSVLYVENDGEKISDEIAGKIFDPFFTTGAGGTGLGLAIVRNIARSHGGDVYLANNESGKVRFEIRF
jgi:signal transduction histidine kinase